MRFEREKELGGIRMDTSHCPSLTLPPSSSCEQTMKHQSVSSASRRSHLLSVLSPRWYLQRPSDPVVERLC